MPYDPQKHHRRSIRLRGYDYSQEGLYFVTLVCHHRKHLFGHIDNGEVHLSPGGEVAEACWLAIPEHFPKVKLHDHIIMPNHVHGILEIIAEGDDSDECTHDDLSEDTVEGSTGDPGKGSSKGSSKGERSFALTSTPHTPTPFRSPSRTLGSIVRGYKIGVTKWFRTHTDQHQIWLRNYYEHIIRNEASYQRIAAYIRSNPERWAEDKFYKT